MMSLVGFRQKIAKRIAFLVSFLQYFHFFHLIFGSSNALMTSNYALPV